MPITPFSSISTASSGMRVYQTWVDAISDNVANVNTIRRTNEAAFRERTIIAAANEVDGGGIGTGASVRQIAYGNAEGRLVHDPDHPLADERGMVRAPDMDLPTQMTNLIVAQRAYQANVTVFERARDAYERALEIGR